MRDFDKSVELIKPIGTTESYLFESLKDEEETTIFMRREGKLANGDLATVNITIDNPEGSGVIRFCDKKPKDIEQDKKERVEFDAKEYEPLYEEYKKIIVGIQDVSKDQPIKFLWNENELTSLYSVLFINGGDGNYYNMLVSDKIFDNRLRMKFLKFYVSKEGKIETIVITGNKNVQKQLAAAFQTILDDRTISMLPTSPVIQRIRDAIVANGEMREKSTDETEIQLNDMNIKLTNKEEDDE